MHKAKAAEILEKAADLYESETIEWCQHQAFRAKGPTHRKVSACALGAITLAAGEYVLTDRYVKENRPGIRFTAPLGTAPMSMYASECLRNHLGRMVPSFNDDPHTSKQQVIDAMKECAKELRNAA